MNKETEKLWYNQRMIIDARVDNPRCWLISKVNRLQSEGLCLITLTQDIFDSNRDYIEKDEFGRIIGMWADYKPTDQYMDYADEIVPSVALPDYHIELKYTGTRPVLKVRGNARKISAFFIDKYNNNVDGVEVEQWKVEMDGVDLIENPHSSVTVRTKDDNSTLTANEIQIKINDDEVLGKVISVSAIKGGLVTTQQFEVVGM